MKRRRRELNHHGSKAKSRMRKSQSTKHSYGQELHNSIKLQRTQFRITPRGYPQGKVSRPWGAALHPLFFSCDDNGFNAYSLSSLKNFSIPPSNWIVTTWRPVSRRNIVFKQLSRRHTGKSSAFEPYNTFHPTHNRRQTRKPATLRIRQSVNRIYE